MQDPVKMITDTYNNEEFTNLLICAQNKTKSYKMKNKIIKMIKYKNKINKYITERENNNQQNIKIIIKIFTNVVNITEILYSQQFLEFIQNICNKEFINYIAYINLNEAKEIKLLLNTLKTKIKTI